MILSIATIVLTTICFYVVLKSKNKLLRGISLIFGLFWLAVSTKISLIPFEGVIIIGLMITTLKMYFLNRKM